MQTKIVLIIEDNYADYKLLQELLLDVRDFNFEMMQVTSVKDALKVLDERPVDIILLDLGLSDSQGINTLDAINTKAYTIPIVILTSMQDQEIAISAVRKGALDYLIKGTFTDSELARTIIYSVERKQTENKLYEYAQIVTNSNDAIFCYDLKGNITSWNKAAEKIYGYTLDEVLGKSISLMIPDENKDDIKDILDTIAHGKSISKYETNRQRKDGMLVQMSLSIAPIKDKMQHITGAAEIGQDISLRKLAEQQLAIEFRVSTALAEAVNLDNAARSVLKTICEILDWQVGQLWAVATKEQKLNCVSTWQTKHTSALLKNINIKNNFQKGEGIVGQIWQSQSPFWTETLKGNMFAEFAPYINSGISRCLGFPITFESEVMGVMLFFGYQMPKNSHNYMSIFASIGNLFGTFIKRKRVEDELLFLAEHDPLTGLANRLTFEDRIEFALINSRRHEKLVAVLYIDLDRFKEINDTRGHDQGDLMLKEAASRLLGAVRSTDTVARLGGDEFAILLPKIPSRDSIEMIASKLLYAFAKPFNIENCSFHVTISIGISIYPSNGLTPKSLLRYADLAMYKAKEQRNCFRFYDEISKIRFP